MRFTLLVGVIGLVVASAAVPARADLAGGADLYARGDYRGAITELAKVRGADGGKARVLMARAQPGGDPLVVRVGSSTFALRCAEAACIEVTLLDNATGAA